MRAAMPPSPPPSVTSIRSVGAGLLALLAAVLVIRSTEIAAPYALLLGLLAAALPVAVLDVLCLKVHRRPSTGLDFSVAAEVRPDHRRVWTKLLGLYATWAAIGFVYWLLPYYRQPAFAVYFTLLTMSLPLIALAAIPYFYFVDRYQIAPEDGYWQVGRLLLGRNRRPDLALVREHCLAWTIKGFFLAFMCSILPAVFLPVVNTPLAEVFSGIVPLTSFLIGISFLIDVAFGLIGYVSTFRPLDSHVRSSNPLVLGWLVALACYPPFNVTANEFLLHYRDGLQWSDWLAGEPGLLTLWAVTLVFLSAVYASATVIFGIRFSNLTHRGIITNGPYRFTKHPAYLAKNLFWWLAAMPFLSVQGPESALRACGLLLAVNVIYLLRAKTEERHLLADPDYRAYAKWIAQHGLFRHLTRLSIGRAASRT